MKKRYAEIEIEVIRFDSTDVIATSGVSKADAFDEQKEDQAVFSKLFC